MKKAIVLFSGGLDSTTCLAYAKRHGFDCYALSFDYGQRNRAELTAAKKITASYEVNHKIYPLALNELGGSALTDMTINVPVYDAKNKQIPTTYVPARNTLFLTIALAWSEILQAKDIFIGVSQVDYSYYPDCRAEYIKAFQDLANLATKLGVEEGGITIHTPLIHLSKAETIKLGYELEVDYAMTVSCYNANEQGQACGKCDSCSFRKKGFSESKIPDVTQYYL